MSGWLDWYNDFIICPSCENRIEIILVEDGDADENIDTSIAGEQKCPYCNYHITDEVLKEDPL